MLRSLVFIAAFAFSSAAFAQEVRLPPQCISNGVAAPDWAACLRASPPGSQWRALPLINLGTEALQRGDYAGAVRYYDEAVPPGQSIISDVIYHSNRARAYSHVGRNAEALVEARIAYRMLHRDPSLPMPPQTYFPPYAQSDLIYASILPVLRGGNAEEFAPAIQEFIALPATDWVSYVNRTVVLSDVEDYQAALIMSTRAVELAPDQAVALNNHCYILFKLGRAQEGLADCVSAVARAPRAGFVRHTYAEVLGALGYCEASENELAAARWLDPTNVSFQRPVPCVAHQGRS
ncbi:MAG: hypothetical protein JNL81_11310 [Hyphomonadaceae bacterium]|nr:hypothetical protein [Hyphomonadaceae bacterium]